MSKSCYLLCQNVKITLFLWKNFGQISTLAEGLWNIPCLFWVKNFGSPPLQRNFCLETYLFLQISQSPKNMAMVLYLNWVTLNCVKTHQNCFHPAVAVLSEPSKVISRQRELPKLSSINSNQPELTLTKPNQPQLTPTNPRHSPEPNTTILLAQHNIIVGITQQYCLNNITLLLEQLNIEGGKSGHTPAGLEDALVQLDTKTVYEPFQRIIGTRHCTDQCPDS